MTKKILAMLLAVCMIVSAGAVFASAKDTKETYANTGEMYYVSFEHMEHGLKYDEVRNLPKADSFISKNYTISSKFATSALPPEVTRIDNSNVRDYYNITPDLDDNIIKVEGTFGSDDTDITVRFTLRDTAPHSDEFIIRLTKDLEDTATGNGDYTDNSKKLVSFEDFDEAAPYQITHVNNGLAETFDLYEAGDWVEITTYDVARLPLPVTPEPLPHDPENTIFHFHFKWNLWKNLTDLSKWLWGVLTFIGRTIWEPIRWLLSYVVDITPHF